MAAQLMATNGLCARPDRRCTARASSSLPVPLSPNSSTVAFVGATFSIARQRLRMASLTPMMPSSAIAPVRSRSRQFSSSSSRIRNARRTTMDRTPASSGLW